MRTSRIFVTEKLVAGQSVNIDADVAHYLTRVLRLKVGDNFNLFNGADGEFSATVSSVSRNQISARINEQIPNIADGKLVINLGLGLSKGERMDFSIQKATELGVSCITGLFTDYSEVKLAKDRLENKLQHWQKIANSACEQCGRNTPPLITPPEKLVDWVAKYDSGIVLDQSGTDSLENSSSGKAFNLLIGPEGGLSKEELLFAQQHQFTTVKLGPRILRTETAPIVALSLIQFLFGDL